MSCIKQAVPAVLRATGVRKKVVLLVYDGIGPFHFSGPLMVFAQNGVCKSPVNFVVCADQPGPVRTSSGLEFPAPYNLNKLERADAIIIPGWISSDAPVPDALQQALRRAHARKAQIVGLCAGVFVLAEAGLLDGRHASVHWLGSAAFAKRYPSVRLLKDSSHSRDDNIWTSAGGAAAIDTCLQLLHELQGGTVADLAARKLVSSTLNQKNQLSCVENADAYRDGNRRLRELLDWIRAHPHEAQHLDALAKRVSMTTRTFTRKFRQLTGMTVVQWRLRQRLKRTQLLLWTSEASIETIAQQTGFSSSLSLRKHFKKAFDMTPTAYRKKRRLDESGGCIIRPSSVSSSSQMG